MSATTSSEEEKLHDDDDIQRNYETADEEENVPYSYTETEQIQPERKRRRVAAEKARELRIQEYAKARIKEIDASKMPHGEVSRRRTSSGEPSHTRSEDGSRSSPAVSRSLPPRVGKRVRRKPQRWEGEGIEARPTRGASAIGTPREADLGLAGGDEESTASIKSFVSVAEPPIVECPFIDLQKAMRSNSVLNSRRDMVDSFHSWQLRTVSKQAAQQKALHIFLKRRLRKRTARSPEYDRMEKEALRNARNSTVKSSKKENGDGDGGQETTVEDELNGNFVVPGKLRLPLEAYLPRRVRPGKTKLTPDDILDMLPVAPDFPESAVTLNRVGDKNWVALPTVTASSEWNTRKSNTRRQVETKYVDMKAKASDQNPAEN